MDEIMLLIMATHGDQGKPRIPKLLAAGIPFRARVRSEIPAARLNLMEATDIAVGDLAEPSFWRAALQRAREASRFIDPE